MKKAIILLTIVSIIVSLCGCAEVTRGNGLSAQPVKIDRKNYVDSRTEALGGIDCTQVMSHITEINRYLTTDKKIPEDPEMWYDKELETIYVQSPDSVLAFRVDEKGNVLFTSCTGSLATKGSINRAIAIATNPSVNSEVEAIQSAVEETDWLNNINRAQLSQQGRSLQFEPLDTTLDTSFGSSVRMFTFNGYPTLTDALVSLNQNVDGLYESSIMSKFWETDSAISGTIGVENYVSTFNNAAGEFGTTFNGYVDLYNSDFNALGDTVKNEYFGAVIDQANADQAQQNVRLENFNANFTSTSGAVQNASIPTVSKPEVPNCVDMVAGMVGDLGNMLPDDAVQAVFPEYEPPADKETCEHNWKTYDAKATCTKDGVAYKTCVLCGKSEQTPIPTTGHSFKTIYFFKVPTKRSCTECGYTEVFIHQSWSPEN